ncbi:BON domain-containing protein [Tuwongella immobilis]|uniref:: BON n=1 Tax=Tuwongella immobilis TaxID=692036 RepID=A0A6C2YVM7_9BACT|nr:BON domain-containing protein [Tuwongella immobilis]VIP04922.1 : BON [Tuwongella immobilis]VTS07203.1 : BON [Tuwongella immobilis]
MKRQWILTLGLCWGSFAPLTQITAAEPAEMRTSQPPDAKRSQAGRLQILSNPQLSGINFGLMIRGSEATLFGTFPSEDLHRLALELTAQLPGVRSVTSDCEVIPPPPVAIEMVQQMVASGGRTSNPAAARPAASAASVPQPKPKVVHRKPTMPSQPIGIAYLPPIPTKLPPPDPNLVVRPRDLVHSSAYRGGVQWKPSEDLPPAVELLKPEFLPDR